MGTWSGDGWSLSQPTTSDISDFNSGVASALNATGSAPIYASRAWANLNTTTSTVTGATYSRSGTLVTVDFGVTDIGLAAGYTAYFNFTSGTATDGAFELLTYALSGGNYIGTFNHTASGTTSGNVEIAQLTIRGSKNISSVHDNAAGYPIAYFIEPMPNANYSVVGSCQIDTNAAYITSFGAEGLFSIKRGVASPLTTTEVHLGTGITSTNALSDMTIVNFAVFG